MSFGLDLHTLTTELQLRVNGSVEHEMGAISVESRHWGMMGYLEKSSGFN